MNKKSPKFKIGGLFTLKSVVVGTPDGPKEVEEVVYLLLEKESMKKRPGQKGRVCWKMESLYSGQVVSLLERGMRQKVKTGKADYQ